MNAKWPDWTAYSLNLIKMVSTILIPMRTAAAVITRSQARQAIGRAELDSMVRSEGAARLPPQNVSSAERDGISRSEETASENVTGKAPCHRSAR